MKTKAIVYRNEAMNIFYIHRDPKKCARYHLDSHVVKMILESAQLLCCAIIMSGGVAPYKLTHKNHPSAIWARASKKNWEWLHSLALELCSEYTFRYGKVHKTEEVLRSLTVPNLPNSEFTQPTQAMPDQYKHTDSLIAYRRFYTHGKAHLHFLGSDHDKTRRFAWKKRRVPLFIRKHYMRAGCTIPFKEN